MTSHPYTSAQRLRDPYEIAMSLASRGLPYPDPSFDLSWSEHFDVRITRARIADGTITTARRAEPWFEGDITQRLRAADGLASRAAYLVPDTLIEPPLPHGSDLRLNDEPLYDVVAKLARDNLSRQPWGDVCRWPGAARALEKFNCLSRSEDRRGPLFNDGDTKIERTTVWNLVWTNGCSHQLVGDTKLLSALLSADTRGWTLKEAKRNGEQVHIEFSESAISVAKRGPDGRIVVLDAKEFY